MTTPKVGLASGLGSGVFDIGVFGQFLVFGGRLGAAIHNDLPPLRLHGGGVRACIGPLGERRSLLV